MRMKVRTLKTIERNHCAYTLNYEELKSHIYRATKVSSSEFDLILKVKYNLEFEAPPQWIMDDDDVHFLLLREELSRLQIAVTLKSKQDERVGMGFGNVSYDDTAADRQYNESYQFCQEEDDIPLSTNIDIPLSINIVPSTFDYMDCGPSVDVDVNEQPAGLNEMDRDHGDVRRSTAASVVPPFVSSSHRTELIMPGTSSSGTEDIEVG
ncbi:uncharacterized protein LOC120091048 [Benincasa hispida]|uniref:uncharacterized protein LOC120091048 n=1 Tax=Benincasa hispida TaxID=102211 RepID=UPI0019025B2C|nr:uncharacterized protein LOC120091048 [Benincasa hispida]